MRNIKELLQVMLSNINKINSWNDGMCILAVKLLGEQIITNDEYNCLLKHIKSNPPKNRYDNSYFFEPGQIQPRIEWLEKHIKLNSKP